MPQVQNLLAETVAMLKHCEKSSEDVRWVVSHRDRSTPAVGSWNDFASFADFNYNASYGGNEIEGSLKIVGDDWWLERGEYDGSEWWEFKTMPTKPDSSASLQAEDLKED